MPDWFPAVSSVIFSSLALYGGLKYEIGKLQSRTEQNAEEIKEIKKRLDEHLNNHTLIIQCNSI